MSFWDNVQGTPDQAFAKVFVDIIPHNTQALATVVKAENSKTSFSDCVQIDWKIISGEFDGQHVFQKLYIYDDKPEKALKAKSMLKLILDLFHVKLLDDNPPSNQLLAQLLGKSAGLKITEWQMPRDDGSMGHGNNIAEVHPIEGFKSESGTYREFKHKTKSGVESALTRNSRTGIENELNDDIPF